MAIAWKEHWKPLAWLAGVFVACALLPMGSVRFEGAVLEGLHLIRWYAREHIALCVVPALFIAGAIGVFVSQGAVMRFLGAGASLVLAYAVASVSGAVLAVCSCTVLPLFAGIYLRGAGLGPACAFLYAGPAINVLAIILTARILGMELGVARVIGAVGFSVVIGLIMAFIFRREEQARQAAAPAPVQLPEGTPQRSLGATILFFGLMILVLVFANWAKDERGVAWWNAIHHLKWYLTAAGGLGLAVVMVRLIGLTWWKMTALGVLVIATALVVPQIPEIAFSVGTVGLGWLLSRSEGEAGEWFDQTWHFTKQILPLLLGGVLVAGFLLGRPESADAGVVPAAWVQTWVGGNGFTANLLASVVGAFMYFATLTELPILEGLMNAGGQGVGMGKGPALALLLAGPALSLPSMLVLASIMGWKKTGVYVGLVIVMATFTGWAFGSIVP
jgi:hypothetical protein